MVGAPDLQGAFGVSYAWTTTALLVVPTLAGMVLEPVLLWLADRYSRRVFLCGGLGALALAAFGAAAAPNLAVMAAALALASAAGGCALGLGQATLMDEHPAERERYLARWSMLGMLGDLAAPLLVGIASSSAFGWRGAFVCVGVVSAVYAAALGPFPLPARVATDETAAASRSVRDVLRNRRLVIWLSATALCGLLDEILVVFAALHLRDDLGLGPAARSAVLACFVAGAIVGLALVDRLLRRGDPLRLLAASAATCAVAFSPCGWSRARPGSPRPCCS